MNHLISDKNITILVTFNTFIAIGEKPSFNVNNLYDWGYFYRNSKIIAQ